MEVYQYGYIYDLRCVTGKHDSIPGLYLSKPGLAAVTNEIRVWIEAPTLDVLNTLGGEGWIISEGRFYSENETAWLLPHVQSLLPEAQRVGSTGERFMRRRVS